MGLRSIALLSAASLALSACVATRQYSDVEFVPPQGDFDLIVMRPNVSVGAITTGGIVEPRADWTDQARANLLESLRAEEAGRGGRTLILEHRDQLQGVSPEAVADLERLFIAVGNSIILHRYAGLTLPTKRRQGLDWTLGEEAIAFGRATDMDYALFLHAEDAIASTGRIAMQILGIAGCFIGFCAPQGGSGQAAYASLVDLHTGEVVWFNLLQAGTQVPGVGVSDIRTREGADAMIERLLGRMRAGRNVRERTEGQEVPPAEPKQ